MHKTTTSRPSAKTGAIVLRNANLTQYDGTTWQPVVGQVELVNIRDLQSTNSSGKPLDHRRENNDRIRYTRFTADDPPEHGNLTFPVTQRYRIPYQKNIHEYLEARKERGNVTYIDHDYNNKDGKLDMRIGDESRVSQSSRYDPQSQRENPRAPQYGDGYVDEPGTLQSQNVDYGDLYSDDSRYPAPGPSTLAPSQTAITPQSLAVDFSHLTLMPRESGLDSSGNYDSSQLQETDNPYLGQATSAFTFTSVPQDHYQAQEYQEAPLRQSRDYSVYSAGGTRRQAHIDHNGKTSYKEVLAKAKRGWSKATSKVKDKWRDGRRDGGGSSSRIVR